MTEYLLVRKPKHLSVKWIAEDGGTTYAASQARRFATEAEAKAHATAVRAAGEEAGWHVMLAPESGGG